MLPRSISLAPPPHTQTKKKADETEGAATIGLTIVHLRWCPSMMQNTIGLTIKIDYRRCAPASEAAAIGQPWEPVRARVEMA
eukprot:SAG25_NODE_21_length_22373_cov_13.904373_18_plen_82_part_00